MLLILTAEEYSILLGLLEDISQAEDILDAPPVQYRMALKSIIQKLGGTYFGKLEKAEGENALWKIIGLISALFASIHLSIANADMEEVLIQTEVIVQESFLIIYIY